MDHSLNFNRINLNVSFPIYEQIMFNEHCKGISEEKWEKKTVHVVKRDQ